MQTKRRIKNITFSRPTILIIVSFQLENLSSSFKFKLKLKNNFEFEFELKLEIRVFNNYFRAILSLYS